MEVASVAQYESDVSDEEVIREDHKINEERIFQKKKSKFWIIKDTFDCADRAEASVGNRWSKYYTNYTEDGRKCYYRCNKVKLRGFQCPTSIYLLYHSDSDQVTVFQTEAAHEHQNDSTRGIDENVKKVIENLFNDGIKKPKLIHRALQSKGINMPTLTQLNNYLVHYRKKKFGANKSRRIRTMV